MSLLRPRTTTFINTKMDKSLRIMNEMNQYAIQQNNAGVNCYVVFGDFDAALHHFRQALTAKLATEKRLLTSTEKGDQTPLPPNGPEVEDKPTGENEMLKQYFTSNDVCINRHDQFEACSYETEGAKSVLLLSFAKSTEANFFLTFLDRFFIIRLCTISLLPSCYNL